MRVVFALFFPDHQGTVHQVLMSLDEVSEELSLVLLGRHFKKLIFLPLELLSNWNLVLQFLAGRLEFVIDIAVTDGVKDSLKQHLCTSSFNLFDQKLFLGKVFVIT
jgi:hypothetical protein